MCIVRLLPEAIFDLIFEHLKHTVFQYDEFLVSRRIKIELESIILKYLLQFISHLYSVPSDFHIQSVCLTLSTMRRLEQSLELHAEQPAFGEQRTMLFHQIHKVLRSVSLCKDHRFTTQGAALGASDVEHVTERGNFMQSEVTFRARKTISQPGAVYIQRYAVFYTDFVYL